MARTIEDIRQGILTEKANYPELDTLSDVSSTAIWKLWVYVVAFAIWVHEKLWDAFKADIDAIKNRAIAGTPQWYVDESKKFQYGDDVIIDPDTFRITYAEIDESKQIIKRAAISAFGRSSTLKIAKEDSNSDAEPLSPEELAAFKVYMNERVQFAGAQINVLSNDADLLKLEAIIYYNGLIPQTEVQTAVEEAINNYLGRSIDFDGRFLKNKMIDAVQSLGYDIDINVLEAKPNIPGGVYQPIDRAYNTFSGYVIVDPVFPLSTQLTYTVE